MNIEIQYSLKTKVRITELQRCGIVIAIWISDTGSQYKVRYFDNAEPREIFFFDAKLCERVLSATHKYKWRKLAAFTRSDPWETLKFALRAPWPLIRRMFVPTDV